MHDRSTGRGRDHRRIGYLDRIFSIGRLDKFSEVLILLNNRGEIVHQILRTSGGHEKEYVVQIDAPISEAALERMRKGIVILGRPTLPCQVEKIGPCAVRMVLTEGRNRQVRRMCEAENLHVNRLKRLRVANIELGTMRRGRYRRISERELAILERRIAAPKNELPRT